ncbi:MAG: hypothetical protein LBI31_06330, partial [Zoogloeaceae bacterium]|nr:hypothetical protein [Zoogloeaceae bacterium]
PLSLFTGYLELDGVRIYPGMTVSELNGRLKTRLFHCMSGLKMCDSIVGDVSITIGTDGRRYGSKIYWISFSDISYLLLK